jgi:hypothetical protein
MRSSKRESKATLSFYAFEPGAPGVPAASATGVYVQALAALLDRYSDRIDVRLRWLRPVEPAVRTTLRERLAALRWMTGQFRQLLTDRSEYLVFLYPKVPVLAHINRPALLAMARHGYQALRLKASLTGQRIIVIMEDLPIEMAEGIAAAGGPPPDMPIAEVRVIERRLLRAAHIIVTPPGYRATILERHGTDPELFQTFQRNIYVPGELEIEFEPGEVNFLYSGAIDTTIASNFRKMLRSIQNAPQARLHVCGPGRDAVDTCFEELGVTNARHYGLLNFAAHDWLAGRCDAGLILWPTDNPYFHLTPTSKYSASVSNGLAVLSTDLTAVADNIRKDGVGRAMPINELSVELLRWAARPSLFAGFKERARQLAPVIRSGAEMDPWLDAIAQSR